MPDLIMPSLSTATVTQCGNSREPKRLPSYEEVRAAFDYDPETGIVTRRKTGEAAGWRTSGHGYLMVGLGARHKKFLLHRIIWVWMTGNEPRYVDHVDLNKLNNKWENLRECSKTENQGNRTKRRDNSSGAKGIHWDASKRKWSAQISKNGQRHFVGRFDDIELAKAAYLVKAVELYGEFARVQ